VAGAGEVSHEVKSSVVAPPDNVSLTGARGSVGNEPALWAKAGQTTWKREKRTPGKRRNQERQWHFTVKVPTSECGSKGVRKYAKVLEKGGAGRRSNGRYDRE